MTRKLMTLRTIDNIEPIKGADRIEKITLGGWEVVSQKNIHTIGDEVLYLEPDSFLSEREPYLDTIVTRGKRKLQLEDGTIIEGHRLKIIKLKGVVSQGMILSKDLFPGVDFKNKDKDYAEELGVYKFELPESAADREANKVVIPKSGYARFKYQVTNYLQRKFPKIFKKLKFKTQFPDFLKKSDLERIQNIVDKIWAAYEANTKFQLSVKADGSSTTVARKDKELYNCSRDLRKHPNGGDLFTIEGNKIHKLMQDRKYKGDYAFQGELLSPNIQGNFEGMLQPKLYIYAMFDIEQREYLQPHVTEALCQEYGIAHVPVLGYFTLKELFPNVVDANDLVKQMIKYADGPSGFNGKYREGVVYKAMESQFKFKTVGQQYLLKYEAALAELEAAQAAEEIAADAEGVLDESSN